MKNNQLNKEQQKNTFFLNDAVWGILILREPPSSSWKDRINKIHQWNSDREEEKIKIKWDMKT